MLRSPQGALLAASGTESEALLGAVVAPPLSVDEVTLSIPHTRGLLQIVSVPILQGDDPTDTIGRMTVGFFLDDRRAVQFKAVTGTEIAFAAGGRVLASSLPASAREGLTP